MTPLRRSFAEIINSFGVNYPFLTVYYTSVDGAGPEIDRYLVQKRKNILFFPDCMLKLFFFFPLHVAMC